MPTGPLLLRADDPPESPAARRPTLTASLKLLYGSGQAVDAVVQAAINTFLLFYLTAVRGMSGSSAGLIFFLSLAVDALLDPFIGRLSDRWQSHWGRRLPFMTVALPVIATSLVAIFSIPTHLSGHPLFAYVLIFNITLRVSLSAFALPHTALNAELTEDYGERSTISSFRALFIVIGTVACTAPAFGLIFAADGLQMRGAYPALGGLSAALVLGFGATCLLGSARSVLALREPISVGADDGGQFFRDLRQLFGNPSFSPLFFGAVLVLVGQGMAASLNLHAYRFFWRLPTAQLQLPVIVIPLGMVIGIPLAALLLKRLEKRDGVIAAVLTIAIYQACLPLLAESGFLERGSLLTLSALVLNGLIFGAGGIVCFICFYSMIADAVDEHDLLFGVRREALYAAALMLGAKAATGLGALMAGVGLQAIGLSSVGATSASTILSTSMINNLGVLWGPAVGALLLISLPVLRRYQIDRKHHEAVLAKLAGRDNEAAAAGHGVFR